VQGNRIQSSLPVLTYHTLDDSGGALSTPPARFRAQMQSLSAAGWRTLDVAAFLDGYRAGQWPARSVALTFDDGYASVLEHAAPVLADRGFTATMFVVTQPGQSRDPAAWPHAGKLLDWAGLRDLTTYGFALGAHSRTHPRLPELAPDEAEHEILGSKQDIEDRLGVAVRAFAYPFGARSPAVEQLAARHFDAAFGTELAWVAPGSRLSALERIDAHYLGANLARALDTPAFRAYIAARRVGRWIRSVGA